MINILLDFFAFGVIFSSVLVISAKNPVIAVLFLISVFINAAGYLILLGLGFIGISYIIVYIGAITVFFLFVIMMINIKIVDILEIGSAYFKILPLALALAGLFLCVFLLGFLNFSSSPFSTSDENYMASFLDVLNFFNTGILGFINSCTEFNSFLPLIIDVCFIEFLQIEMLGYGLYTYGAIWLILSSFVLLLALVSPIIIFT